MFFEGFLSLVGFKGKPKGNLQFGWLTPPCFGKANPKKTSFCWVDVSAPVRIEVWFATSVGKVVVSDFAPGGVFWAFREACTLFRLPLLPLPHSLTAKTRKGNLHGPAKSNVTFDRMSLVVST